MSEFLPPNKVKFDFIYIKTSSTGYGLKEIDAGASYRYGKL